MSNYVYRILATLEFPEGIMPGEGSESNELTVARNGQGQPILRGTALAGALRSRFPEDASKTWFGEPSNGQEPGHGSRVRVVDSILDVGKSSISPRTHHMRNRHTGVVVDGGLFSMEHLPPGTTGSLLLYVDMRDMPKSDCDEFIERLRTILGTELTLGGNRNRGVGRTHCQNGQLTLDRYDLSQSSDYAAWMDARYADRQGQPAMSGQTLEVLTNSNSLTVMFTLGTPRGEDFLIADGNDMVPQETTSVTGNEYWRIPGSSLRGLLRSWMTRLAVREGETIRDSHEQWDEQFDHDDAEEYKPHLVGWAFITDSKVKKNISKHPEALNDPILDLFGSMYKRGRIHIADALSSRPMDRNQDRQERAHVAIDRFSGGANEGALFSNYVLIAHDLTFSVAITLEAPEEKEVQWLVKTLRALHLGILSVGSSKSGGHLEIRSIKANGKMKDKINTFAEEIS